MKSGIIRYYTTPGFYINLSADFLNLVSDTIDNEILNKFKFAKTDINEIDFYLDSEVESDLIITREIFMKQGNGIMSFEIKLPYRIVVKKNITDNSEFIRLFVNAVSLVLKPYLIIDDEIFELVINQLLAKTANNPVYKFQPANDVLEMQNIVADAMNIYKQNKNN